MAERVRGKWRQSAARSFILAAVVDGRGAQVPVHGARMTDAVECRYHGRDFSAEEMALLRVWIADPPALSRHALSREFCRHIGWFKPDGGLKDGMAHVTKLAMHRDGVIHLPPPRPHRPLGLIAYGLDTEPPPFLVPTDLDEVSPSTSVSSCAAPAKANSGTSSSSVTTARITRLWSASRCATMW